MEMREFITYVPERLSFGLVLYGQLEITSLYYVCLYASNFTGETMSKEKFTLRS